MKTAVWEMIPKALFIQGYLKISPSKTAANSYFSYQE